MIELSDIEARVVGSLIEKSIVTPDQYPMTLNALTSACNQKSSRNPVMALSQGEVLHAIRGLTEKHLVRTEENFKSRTDKFSQRFCGTRYSDLQFDAAEVAVICLLLLRGPQTPGELKTRSARLHQFADNSDVVRVLDSLADVAGGPLIVKLPRTPGRKDSEYMHLFCGEIDIDEHADQAREARPAVRSERSGVAALTERVEKLEAAVAELKALIN